MVTLQHVVCPVDFSDSSRRALDYAAALATWYEARLTVLHVYVNLPVVDAVPRFGGRAVSLHDNDPEVLKDTLRTFVAGVHCDAPITQQVAEGSSAERGLQEQIEALHPDLLVMGTHGRSGLERLLLGSVTERVIRTAPCPVLVVPPHAEGPGRVGPFQRIVCAIDFSKASAQAVRYALDLAQEADAEIVLLHVIEMPPELHDAGVAAGIDVAQIRAAAEAECLARLRGLVPDEARTYCTVATEVVEGRAHREIVRVAMARHADLVVMGVQGRSAVDRLIFGSNTHAVLKSAPCPVLTVTG